MRKKNPISNIKYLIAAIIVMSGILFASHIGFAQTSLNSDTAFGGATGQTAEGLAGEAGLGTTDFRLVVARIINIALGFLGIIAVGLIIYAGFLWMTAAGNESQIAIAKKIMTGAVIGLVIILAAFGIAAFVIRVLLGATGGGGGGNGTGGPYIGPPGELPAEFLLVNTSPANNTADVIRNVVISYYFNSAVKSDSVDGNTFTVERVIIANQIPTYQTIAGTQAVDGSKIEFVPQEICPEPNQDRKCLPENSIVRVVATEGILRLGDDRALECSGSAAPCVIQFQVGTIVDTRPPTVNFNDVGQMCAGRTVNLSATAEDDSYVRHVKFFAASTQINSEVVNTNAGNPFNAQITWDTAAYAAGAAVDLRVEAYDADSNTAQANRTITLRADHCCNLTPDADETGIDYGGNDCAAGPGSSCSANNLAQCSDNNDNCATGVCSGADTANCQCQAVPIIDFISPDNGAFGNLVTIGGRFFGGYDASKSKVSFCSSLNSDGQCGQYIAAALANSVNNNCAGSWQDTQIVAVVPTNAGIGPIKVEAASGYADESNDGRGANINFTVNNVRRPGLCQIVGKTQADSNATPHQEVQAPIVLHGINFGASTANNPANVIFGQAPNSYPSLSGYNFSWSPKIIGTIAASALVVTAGPHVPNIMPGLTSVRVKVGDIESNPLSIIVESSQRAPFITRVDPSAGHAGDYVTIYGGNFGDTRGEVKFGNTNADFSFPPECSQREIWRNSQIIVKVPEGLTDRSYTIKVTAGGLDGDLANGFRYGNYCTHDAAQSCIGNKDCDDLQTGSTCVTTAKPGLCALTPDNGPVSAQVNFYGERFGSTKGKAKFYQNKESITEDNNWVVGTAGRADKAIAAVPTGSQSGPAKVLNSTNIESNGLNFRVGSCLGGAANACATGQTCCGAATQFAGSCLASADACGLVPSRTYAQYYFEFSTTSGGGGGNTIYTAPTVVEECNRNLNNCQERRLPSPSPLTPLPANWSTTPAWTDDGTKLACTNAVITARFDQFIDHNTLVVSDSGKTIIVNKCDGAGDNCNTQIEHSSALGKEFVISNSNDQTAFIFTPSALEQNSWYEVTLTTGIRSIPQRGGLPLGSEYKWKFHTKNDNSPCRLSCLSVAPVTYTARALNEEKEYVAIPQQDDNACVMLDGGSYTYNWDLKEVAGLQPTLMYSPLPTNKAERVNSSNHSNKDTVRALSETAVNLPLHSIANTRVGDNSYSGYGEFKIEFNDFYIQEEFPTNQCVTVCTNAEVGAVLSDGIYTSSLSADKVALFECEDQSCENDNLHVATGIALHPRAVATTRQGLNDKLYFSLTGNLLLPDRWYKAAVKMGADGIKSDDGKNLIYLTNDPRQSSRIRQESIGNASYITWQFKTGQRACEADTVNVYPDPAIATVVGQTIRHNAEALSNSQMCVPGSPQILRGVSYNWQWSSDDALVADISQPLFRVSDKNAPSQNVDTVGEGDVIQLDANQCQLAANGFDTDKQGQQTKINAGINVGDPSSEVQLTSTSGNNDFCLVCGNTNDSQCKIMNAQGVLVDANSTHGVGANTCCYPRPYVESATPANDAPSVCRNALVSVQFNEEMDIASFNNNVLVAAKYDGACPENWPYLLLADAGNKTFNQVSWLSRAINLAVTKLAKLPLVGKIFNPFAALATNYGSTWCVAPGNLGGSNQVQAGSTNSIKGVATFAPRDLFKAGSEHLILIKGDRDLTDGVHEGAKNIYGVSIGVPPSGAHGVICRGNPNASADEANDCIVNGAPFYGQLVKFTALSDDANNNHGICAADRVTMTPVSHLFTTNQNIDGDNTIETAAQEDFADSDKLFIAEAQSANGQDIVSIEDVYSWGWAWSTDNIAVAQVSIETGAKSGATADPNKAIIFTEANVRSSTFARAQLHVSANQYEISGSPDIGGAAQIWVLLCNNPWPFYQEAWRPWQDTGANCRDGTGTCLNTNFEFYYCRDKGSANFNDDLPVLDDNGAILGQNNTIGVLKEFLFTQPAASAPPQLRVYTELVEPADDSDHNSTTENDVNGDGVIDVFDDLFAFVSARISNRDVVLNNGEVIIVWSSPWSDVWEEYSHQIYQAQGNNSWGEPRQVDNTTCHTDSSIYNIGCYFKISNLRNDMPYRFAVTSLKPIDVAGNNQLLESAFSNAVTVTPQRTVPPTPPTALSARIEGNAVTLSWTKSTDNDVTAYKVYRGIGADANHEVREVGNVNSYTWQNLAANRTYYFKVQAVAGGQESAANNTIRINVGPVGYWKLDRSSVSYNADNDKFIIRDFSSFNIAGTINSTEQDLLEWQNNALGFRHNEYAINIPSTAGLDLSQSSGFTQSAWIKPDITFDITKDNYATGINYFGVLGYQENNQRVNFRAPSIFVVENGKVHAGFGTGADGKWCNIFTERSVLEKDKWYFVGLTYDKNTSRYKVYINNQPSLEYQPVNTLVTGNPPCNNNYPDDVRQLTIGKVGDKYFRGSIAEVKIYNYVRTPEQMQADYNSAQARFEIR